MTAYTFTVNLSSGDTTPEYNVTYLDNSALVALPVNRMPMPLINNDTITFAFNMGDIGYNPSCKFYCWPMGPSSSASPFYNGPNPIIAPLLLATPSPPMPPITMPPNLLKPPLEIITSDTTITITPPKNGANTFSFWEFALVGLFHLKSSGDSPIPFFVDPEAECSSG